MNDSVCPGGEAIYTFVHSNSYKECQSMFLQAVSASDVSALQALLYLHPYHLDTLLQLAEMSNRMLPHLQLLIADKSNRTRRRRSIRWFPQSRHSRFRTSFRSFFLTKQRFCSSCIRKDWKPRAVQSARSQNHQSDETWLLEDCIRNYQSTTLFRSLLWSICFYATVSFVLPFRDYAHFLGLVLNFSHQKHNRANGSSIY